MPELSAGERLRILEDGEREVEVPVVRDGAMVVADLEVPGWGNIVVEASNIRRTYSGVHAQLRLCTNDGKLLTMDAINVEKDRYRTTLANSTANRIGGDKARAQQIKVRLDLACAQIWEAWVRSDSISDEEAYDFLGKTDPPPEWVIPGILERRERVILVANEGRGKSTLLRQLALQASAGIHPFTGDHYRPVRAMIVDAENSARHIRRQLRPLVVSTKGRLEKGTLRICADFDAIDLLSNDDSDRLAALVHAHATDLLVIGPNYKLASGDPNAEETARAVTSAVDRIRHDTGCAVLMESHMPHASNGTRRPWRPYGASLWLRWPEFGLYLRDDGVVGHWRGAREERAWPGALKRGGAWPWTVADTRGALSSDAEIEECLKASMNGHPITARTAFRLVREAELEASNERVNRARNKVNREVQT